MLESSSQDGASVHVRGSTPSIDLATIIKFLCKAFPEKEGHPPASWSVLNYHKNRLSINTFGILHRFTKQEGFLEALSSMPNHGFVRDLISPPRGISAKLGGRLFDDSIADVSKQTKGLKKLIEDEIDKLGVTADDLFISDPETEFNNLSKALRLNGILNESTAKIAEIEFAKTGQKSLSEEKYLARLISAKEYIQSENKLEQMTQSVIDAQLVRDDEFNEIQQDKLRETLRQDFDRPDSQVAKFFNFLEDDALSRVRLKISFAIMRSLAFQAEKSTQKDTIKFADFVRRVIKLKSYYGTSESEHSLYVDLTKPYGLNASFSLSQELAKVLFYKCLPVWSESNTQLFESHCVDSSNAASVVRDVSYRFKVNGNDPKSEMEPAFDARLKRLKQALVNPEEEPSPFTLRRSISEVIFLWLVLNPALELSNLTTEAEQLLERIHKEGQEGIKKLLDDLSVWASDVKQLSHAMVELLRKKSCKVITNAQKEVDDLYLVVQQGIIDWSAIERSKGRVKNIFIKTEAGQSSQSEWFNNIQITNNPSEVLEPLFSIKVKTVLNERIIISKKDNISTIKTQREMPDKLLNIAWMPINVYTGADKKLVRKSLVEKLEPVWRENSGIDIWYSPNLLNRNPEKNTDDNKQYRAATAAAMTVLIYVFLQVLSEKFTQKNASLAVLMMRFQSKGKDAHKNNGNHWIYAISKTIEAALKRDIPVRMQGMVVDNKNEIYKKKGSVFALSAAFPMIITTEKKPNINKIAVIVYTTRPCDEHPTGDDSSIGFTFRAKTYTANTRDGSLSGYCFSLDRMQTHVVETRDAFRSPKLIVEEVSRLQNMGYEHIILISSYFGNRSINRSAQRHSIHTQTTFLDEVAAKFPQVSLYMLRRDVFPATRLHTRSKNESAFEAMRISDHDEFVTLQDSELLKQHIPVYTFATLSIVGFDDLTRPQSGFCTYFWDADYQVKSAQWRERVRSNLLNSNNGTRDCLLSVLRGIHFMEAEKAPENGVSKPVLDPFSWVQPTTSGAAGEIEIFPPSRRSGGIYLSLPAMLSHVSDSLHGKQS